MTQSHTCTPVWRESIHIRVSAAAGFSFVQLPDNLLPTYILNPSTIWIVDLLPFRPLHIISSAMFIFFL